MPHRLHLALDSHRDEIPRLLDALAALWTAAAVPEGDRYRMDLALDELVTNVIDYAGAHPGEDGTAGIHLEVVVERLPQGQDRVVVVEIRDNGRPYDPTRRAPPDITSAVEDRPIGGLGVFLSHAMTDTMDYYREDGWNHLRLTRKLAGTPQEEGDEAHGTH